MEESKADRLRSLLSTLPFPLASTTQFRTRVWPKNHASCPELCGGVRAMCIEKRRDIQQVYQVEESWVVEKRPCICEAMTGDSQRDTVKG